MAELEVKARPRFIDSSFGRTTMVLWTVGAGLGEVTGVLLVAMNHSELVFIPSILVGGCVALILNAHKIEG
ncbi:hypothetical protein HY030_02725 [Candidatus Gottesmanbacteria bacterium]|nr:hypothetical protein [Candidatus Gottesmanbacteria bacterium]